MKTEEYKEDHQQINNVSVCITTYKIGDDYHCHVSSIDPGATISRANASTMEQAREEAIRKASLRIKPSKDQPV